MTAYAASHPTDEALSAYLDDELAGRRREQVSDHLARCPGCRADLDALRRVSRALGRLEHAAPPPVLAQRVEHRVGLESRRRSLVERLEERLTATSLDSSIGLGFALIFALAVIVYVFSHGMAAHEQRNAGATLQVAPTESARRLLDAVDAETIAGRDFQLRDGVWREVATHGETPTAVLRADDPEAVELIGREPWIAELLAASDAVVLRDGERVVEVRDRW